jgi:alkanesulfonate monooxygenase SsuD/methylene tetrahydromethanopterin reductase-like flavin-dependent oxidoreductase (luciferase family)
MEFALITEVPYPEPWTRQGQRDAVHRVVEEARAADKHGFHSFWAVEHHLIPDLSMSSAPEVLLSAVANATERIRIGHGVRLMPHGYNNPIRIAEMGAWLDLISNGRLEFGVGRSASRMELQGFGIDPNEAGPMQDEAIDFVLRAWLEGELEYKGKYFEMPRRLVVPQPYQEPHPPLWWAGSSPTSHTRAGEMGVNLLSFSLSVAPDVVAQRVAEYRAGLARAKPIGQFVQGKAGVCTMVGCAPTAQEAKEAMEGSVLRYTSAYGRIINDMKAWMDGGRDVGTYSYFSQMWEEAHAAEEAGFEVTYDGLADMGAIICGDPDTVIRVAKQYEEAGTDLLLCLVNPNSVKHEAVMQTIELMGKEVLPAFKNG